MKLIIWYNCIREGIIELSIYIKILINRTRIFKWFNIVTNFAILLCTFPRLVYLCENCICRSFSIEKKRIDTIYRSEMSRSLNERTSFFTTNIRKITFVFLFLMSNVVGNISAECSNRNVVFTDEHTR